MIIYNKNSKTSPVISVPKPMGYALRQYHLCITDTSTGKEYRMYDLEDIGTSGDFVVLQIESLNMLPVGDYSCSLNDGYSTTSMRIVDDSHTPTYYTPEQDVKEREVIYNG